MPGHKPRGRASTGDAQEVPRAQQDRLAELVAHVLHGAVENSGRDVEINTDQERKRVWFMVTGLLAWVSPTFLMG